MWPHGQAAVCLGGLAFMDFENAGEPKTKKLELSFETLAMPRLVKVGAGPRRLDG